MRLRQKIAAETDNSAMVHNYLKQFWARQWQIDCPSSLRRRYFPLRFETPPFGLPAGAAFPRAPFCLPAGTICLPAGTFCLPAGALSCGAGAAFFPLPASFFPPPPFPFAAAVALPPCSEKPSETQQKFPYILWHNANDEQFTALVFIISYLPSYILTF